MRTGCLLLAAACGSPDEGGDVHRWSDGDGVACVHESQSGTYQVVVDFQELIECWRRDAFTCEVVVDGGTVTVHAEGAMDMSTCGTGGTAAPAVVRCEPVAIAAGAYRLVYGAAETAVDLPLAEGEEVCTGEM